jgi:hypothetical protein
MGKAPKKSRKCVLPMLSAVCMLSYCLLSDISCLTSAVCCLVPAVCSLVFNFSFCPMFAHRSSSSDVCVHTLSFEVGKSPFTSRNAHMYTPHFTHCTKPA